jgi:hypothetical protein
MKEEFNKDTKILKKSNPRNEEIDNLNKIPS